MQQEKMKTFQDIIDHCLDRGGEWYLLLIFLRLHDKQTKTDQENAYRIEFLYKAFAEVTPDTLFEALPFETEESGHWDCVAVVPSLGIKDSQEVARLFNEMMGNLKNNPQAIPLFDRQGNPLTVDLNWTTTASTSVH